MSVRHSVMDWWVFARNMKMDGRVVARAMMMLELEELEKEGVCRL
jgi:hypothetical protein